MNRLWFHAVELIRCRHCSGLVNDASFNLFTFTELTRFLPALIDVPYRLALSLLSTGFLSGQGSSAVQQVPPLSWIGATGLAAQMGFYAGGRGLALLVAACFAFLASFGQWDSAMVTRQGGVEAARPAPVRSRHCARDRPGYLRHLMPGLWPLGWRRSTSSRRRRC